MLGILPAKTLLFRTKIEQKNNGVVPRASRRAQAERASKQRGRGAVPWCRAWHAWHGVQDGGRAPQP